MGLQIINSAADYSSLGLGFSDWVTEFLYNASITDPAKKTAVRKLYTDAVAAGLWSKMYGMAFFPGDTANTQKHIFRESLGTLTFVGAGVHTSAGYQPNTTIAGTAYADTNWIPPAGVINNMAIGAYNATSETQEITQVHQFLGLNGAGSAGSAGDMYIGLSRNRGNNLPTLGYLHQKNGGNAGSQIFLANPPYDSTKTGLLQLLKNANVYTLVDDGVQITQATHSSYQNPVGGGTVSLAIGANKANGSVGGYSLARLTFAYWSSGLTVVESQTWNTIVKTFLTAFGR
jgi:hypothetical protein